MMMVDSPEIEQEENRAPLSTTEPVKRGRDAIEDDDYDF